MRNFSQRKEKEEASNTENSFHHVIPRFTQITNLIFELHHYYLPGIYPLQNKYTILFASTKKTVPELKQFPQLTYLQLIKGK